MCLNLDVLDIIQKLSNHPVHIITEDKKPSPSAFIPFCAYGSNTLMMAQRVKHFHTPVCNSFKAKIFNNQLCYEVDVNRIVRKQNITKKQEQGDYNDKTDKKKEEDFVDNLGMHSPLNHQ